MSNTYLLDMILEIYQTEVTKARRRFAATQSRRLLKNEYTRLCQKHAIVGAYMPHASEEEWFLHLHHLKHLIRIRRVPSDESGHRCHYS